MKKSSSSLYLYGAAILIVIGFAFYAVKSQTNTASDSLNTFAQCLADKGTKMYGAWWCPHCKSQKDLFGTAFKKIPYTECSVPNSSAMNQECKDAGIEGYPTWEFADGTRVSGEQSLENLGKKSECVLEE